MLWCKGMLMFQLPGGVERRGAGCIYGAALPNGGSIPLCYLLFRHHEYETDDFPNLEPVTVSRIYHYESGAHVVFSSFIPAE